MFRNKQSYYAALKNASSPDNIPFFLNKIIGYQKAALEHSLTLFYKQFCLKNFWQIHDKEDFSNIQQKIIKNIALDMSGNLSGIKRIKDNFDEIPNIKEEWKPLVQFLEKGHFDWQRYENYERKTPSSS